MAHRRIHNNLQALNRTLEELKDNVHRYTRGGTVPHGWQNRNVKRTLDTLHRYLDNLREIETANRIPEVGDVIQKVENLLEKIEQEAQERGYSPTDPAVLTDDPPVKTYVHSTRNNLDDIISLLELNPREIAKNVYGDIHSPPEGLSEDFLDMLTRAQTQRMPSQRARVSHHASKRKKRKRYTRHGKKKSHKKRKKRKKSRKLKGGAAPAPRPGPARAHVVPGPLPVPREEAGQDGFNTEQTGDSIPSQTERRQRDNNIINTNYDDENDSLGVFDDFTEDIGDNNY